jgi:hypothetical protein
MKMIFFLLLSFCVCELRAQAPEGVYFGVKAKWTETRLVDDAPYPPRRENRLVLTFYQVDIFGNYIPIMLSNYDLWIFKEGAHYGSYCGDIFDSCGNNYPGYPMTAPKVVAHHNSYALNYEVCSPSTVTQYIVNGQELDCGFIQVSHWETHPDTFIDHEIFTTPNVCLPYYTIAPYPNFPGNLNFQWPIPPSNGNHFFSFACGDGIQQFVMKGVLPADSSVDMESLPVKFANVRAVKFEDNVKVSWSNMTESDILHYEVERSVNGVSFQSIGTIHPQLNNYGRADYVYTDSNAIMNSKLFYRIKAVEITGHSFFSQVMRIQLSGEKISKLILYPNPTKDKVTLQITNAAAGKYAIVLVSMAGREKLVQSFEHGGGSVTQRVSLDEMPAGLYIVLVKSNEKTFSAKLSVRN